MSAHPFEICSVHPSDCQLLLNLGSVLLNFLHSIFFKPEYTTIRYLYSTYPVVASSTQHIFEPWTALFSYRCSGCPNLCIIIGESLFISPVRMFLWLSQITQLLVPPRNIPWQISSSGWTGLVIGWKDGLQQLVSSQLCVLYYCVNVPQYYLKIYSQAVLLF
jgi:hypothetical protein